jgi:D-serine deaminase-like pyridoxal phosphate-dependent protein
MGYEGHTLMIADPDAKRDAIGLAMGKLLQTRGLVEAAGHPCRIISAGGSGSYQYTADIAGITEIQAGGGIFACQYYTKMCQVKRHQPALSVLATVVSRPARDRAILDAGQKAISQYQTPPILRDYPNCRVEKLSAEHATIAVDSQNDLPIGEKVHVIPGYSDFTFVLHDRVLGWRHGHVEAVWALLGRGCLQ